MKNWFFLVLFLFFAQLGFGQTQDSCNNAGRTYIKPEYAASFGTDPADLQKFFDGAFQSVERPAAIVNMALLIDSAGKAQFSSASYLKPTSMDDSVLIKVVNQMPVWTPARQKNCFVQSAIFVKLNIKKESVELIYHKSQTATN